MSAYGEYDRRALATWARVLTYGTATYLFLLAMRGLSSFATDDALLLSTLDISLKIAAVATTAVALIWLHRASRNAHAISPGMRYSPNAAVGWFFAPAVNLLFSVGIIYEIWTRSGGPQRSSLLIGWWAVTMPSIYIIYPVWLVSSTTTGWAPLLLAISPLTFLILARRIDGYQARAGVAAEFGEPGAEAPEPRAEDWVPFTAIEPVYDPRSVGTVDTTPAVALTPTPLGKPGVIVVKRPSPGGDPPA